jgi:hypothetical protein
MLKGKVVQPVLYKCLIMVKLSIYLAGGMDSDWQSQIIEKYRGDFFFFNPRDHQLQKSEEFTVWDLLYLQKADILFAFMEKDNPSGFGLTLEVGFARALGKTIILIDEKSSSDTFFKDKFRIVRDSSSIVFDNIKEGTEYLGSFLRVKGSNQI